MGGEEPSGRFDPRSSKGQAIESPHFVGKAGKKNDVESLEGGKGEVGGKRGL